MDRTDGLITSLAKYSSVPVINMETIVHPCQELALMQTLRERLGSVRKKKFVLTWTWHPRPLNTAVANSALLIATRFGDTILWGRNYRRAAIGLRSQEEDGGDARGHCGMKRSLPSAWKRRGLP